MFAVCRFAAVLLFVAAAAARTTSAQSLHPRLLDAGIRSGLPLVEANDNRAPAGTLVGGALDLNLEVVWADWRIETPDGPGLRVAAIAESGGPPVVPAPLVRIETGTHVRVRIHNTLTDSSITAFGFQRRPTTTRDSLFVEAGSLGTVEFDAGEPGTYFYWIQLGAGIAPGESVDEREQLAGAFIVDPVGGSSEDRVFVLNIFSMETDTTRYQFEWLEALTINGLSWPFTERIRPEVGDTLRWRIVNVSGRNHPMHLHGFFYDVQSIGGLLRDDIYKPEDRRTVVTEFMRGRSTMAMEWVASRPGNWLFHCHLSFHVAPALRLPTAAKAHRAHDQPHMAGLVTGIEIQPGPSDLISRGEPRNLTLHVNEYPADSSHAYGFSTDADYPRDDLKSDVPGPMLLLKQYQPTFVTVENHMSIPTGIHWHGLELDSWADGVPEWSASDGKMSPVIEPGASFTYKLSLMRPGTFIYHSHLDDVTQLTGGLYGVIVVLPAGEAYQPETDHSYVAGWKDEEGDEVELNGRTEQPVMHAVVGETHRLRVVHIAPAGNITARMVKGETPVPLRMVAKDGAELPTHQRVNVEISRRMGVGETADFEFTPTEAGTYEFVIGYPRRQWRQRWVVAAVGK